MLVKKLLDEIGRARRWGSVEVPRKSFHLVDAGRKFHSIAHFLTPETLWRAFDNLRKNAVAGVDGVTCADYEEHLIENLVKLHEKLTSKTYRAQPLRRIYIDKEDRKKRPI